MTAGLPLCWQRCRPGRITPSRRNSTPRSRSTWRASVTKVELINPHAWIHVDVKDADGKVTSWMVEAGSPNVLLRRGFTKATVATGTPVVVEGYQSKDGSMRANGRDITLPDGQKLFLGSSGHRRAVRPQMTRNIKTVGRMPSCEVSMKTFLSAVRWR